MFFSGGVFFFENCCDACITRPNHNFCHIHFVSQWGRRFLEPVAKSECVYKCLEICTLLSLDSYKIYIPVASQRAQEIGAVGLSLKPQ